MAISAEFREYLLLVLRLLEVLLGFAAALLWPLVATIVAVILRRPVTMAFDRSNELLLKLGEAEVRLSRNEAVDALSEVFAEIDTILKLHLTNEERTLFARLAVAPDAIRVDDIFLEFRRESPEHKQLRALRGVYFIRPVGGGHWQAAKYIEITSLGRLVVRYKRHLLV